MRKLILKCGLSLGDIVLLTAAVRDLHSCYPEQFLTDVRTSCAELWEHNPFVTSLSENDPAVEQIECSYPLINHNNELPFHAIHGFIHFLNSRLGLQIMPTAFKGDLHLSAQERAWYSQVHEAAGQDIPFWLVASGGKHDLTIKWWDTARYQDVVNRFLGRIQFVQVGRRGDHHPKLNGVIDLRGQTSVRELVRLVYHAQGVLCSVTGLMHLAAAVETKSGRPKIRPCVVVAGGREPAHWEAYPGHQFIHTIGALPCCSQGGCWRDRTVPLRDGDHRDRPANLCLNVTHDLPRCMGLIEPDEVARRIEFYHSGGNCHHLSPREFTAAEKGVASTNANEFDGQSLSISSAGLACDHFCHSIPPYPGRYEGRGIVICGGGVRYLVNVWVCLNMLRRLGCQLPVELWHLGSSELDETMRQLLEPFGVKFRDAHKNRRRFPSRILNGWELKSYAIVHSRFREVMLLDADNVPVVNPEFLFDINQYHRDGALFWPDFAHEISEKTHAIWRSCGLKVPAEPEFETGQIVVNKEKCWPALRLALWFNENSDFYYQYIHGDKETFHLAFRKMKQRYSLVPHPIQALPGTMCQHDFNGRRIFQHRNMRKWDLLFNKRTKDFWFEDECLGYLEALRGQWDGGMKTWGTRGAARSGARLSLPRIEAVMISCPERHDMCRRTLENLKRTDWGDWPLKVYMDPGVGDDHVGRQVHCAFAALKEYERRPADYILFLEDDLDFNKNIRHNLLNWAPVRERIVTLASLYNPQLREAACDLVRNARIIRPRHIFGSQAFLLETRALKYVLQHWNSVGGGQDIKISRLAGRLKKPILYHAPSLVQHIGTRSTWKGGFHDAIDFDPDWKARFLGQNPLPGRK